MCEVRSAKHKVRGAKCGVRRASYRLRDTAPRTPHPAPRAEHGFTLLEVMIALAILGVAFALSMELLANGVRSAKASENYTQAVLLARQKLAEVAATPNLEGSADTGDFGGGFRWSSEILPIPQEEDLPARLFQVRVRVIWPGRRGEKALDLYTLRMAVDQARFGQARAVPLSSAGRDVDTGGGSSGGKSESLLK